MNAQNPQSVWWERVAALAALVTLAAFLAASQSSCGGEDLLFSGQIPATATSSATATATPFDEEDDEGDDFF